MKKYSKKFKKLLIKICKDLKIDNGKKEVKDYLKNTNICF